MRSPKLFTTDVLPLLFGVEPQKFVQIHGIRPCYHDHCAIVEFTLSPEIPLQAVLPLLSFTQSLYSGSPAAVRRLFLIVDGQKASRDVATNFVDALRAFASRSERCIERILWVAFGPSEDTIRSYLAAQTVFTNMENEFCNLNDLPILLNSENYSTNIGGDIQLEVARQFFEMRQCLEGLLVKTQRMTTLYMQLHDDLKKYDPPSGILQTVTAADLQSLIDDLQNRWNALSSHADGVSLAKEGKLSCKRLLQYSSIAHLDIFLYSNAVENALERFDDLVRVAHTSDARIKRRLASLHAALNAVDFVEFAARETKELENRVCALEQRQKCSNTCNAARLAEEVKKTKEMSQHEQDRLTELRRRLEDARALLEESGFGSDDREQIRKTVEDFENAIVSADKRIHANLTAVNDALDFQLSLNQVYDWALRHAKRRVSGVDDSALIAHFPLPACTRLRTHHLTSSLNDRTRAEVETLLCDCESAVSAMKANGKEENENEVASWDREKEEKVPNEKEEMPSEPKLVDALESNNQLREELPKPASVVLNKETQETAVSVQVSLVNKIAEDGSTLAAPSGSSNRASSSLSVVEPPELLLALAASVELPRCAQNPPCDTVAQPSPFLENEKSESTEGSVLLSLEGLDDHSSKCDGSQLTSALMNNTVGDDKEEELRNDVEEQAPVESRDQTAPTQGIVPKDELSSLPECGSDDDRNNVEGLPEVSTVAAGEDIQSSLTVLTEFTHVVPSLSPSEENGDAAAERILCVFRKHLSHKESSSEVEDCRGELSIPEENKEVTAAEVSTFWHFVNPSQTSSATSMRDVEVSPCAGVSVHSTQSTWARSALRVALSAGAVQRDQEKSCEINNVAPAGEFDSNSGTSTSSLSNLAHDANFNVETVNHVKVAEHDDKIAANNANVSVASEAVLGPARTSKCDFTAASPSTSRLSTAALEIAMPESNGLVAAEPVVKFRRSQPAIANDSRVSPSPTHYEIPLSKTPNGCCDDPRPMSECVEEPIRWRNLCTSPIAVCAAETTIDECSPFGSSPVTVDLIDKVVDHISSEKLQTRLERSQGRAAQQPPTTSLIDAISRRPGSLRWSTYRAPTFTSRLSTSSLFKRNSCISSATFDLNAECGSLTSSVLSLNKPPLSMTDERAVNVNGGDANCRIQCNLVRELHDSECEYVRNLRLVVEEYMPEMERSDIPSTLRNQRSFLFGNIAHIFDFHSKIFLPQLTLRLQEPTSEESISLIAAKLFVDSSRFFDLYSLYARNKPKADDLVTECAHAFFSSIEKRDLTFFLEVPLNRIRKYTVILQQLQSAATLENRELYETLRKATAVVGRQIRHGADLLAVDYIRGSEVSVLEQGALLRYDRMLVADKHGFLPFTKKRLRNVFLFEKCVLITKPKITKQRGGHDELKYKGSLQIANCGLTEMVKGSKMKFELWHRKQRSRSTYLFEALSEDIRNAWVNVLRNILWMQNVQNRAFIARDQPSFENGVGTALMRFSSNLEMLSEGIGYDNPRRPQSMISEAASSCSSSNYSTRIATGMNDIGGELFRVDESDESDDQLGCVQNEGSVHSPPPSFNAPPPPNP